MTKFSFAEWSLTEWFKGNWSTIKEVLKVGAPLLASWMLTGNFWLTGFGTILGKFILDSIHYWLKK